MSHYKNEAKSASQAKMKRMGLHKEHKSEEFNDVGPYDGVPQLDSGNAGQWPKGKQRFKRGGKVAHLEGDKARKNLGKSARKKRDDGGRLPGENAQYANARAKAYNAYKNTKEAGEAADKIYETNEDPTVRQFARENAQNVANKAVGPDQDLGKAMKETGYGYARGGIPKGSPAKRQAMVGALANRKKKAGIPSGPAAPRGPMMNIPTPVGAGAPAVQNSMMHKKGGAVKHRAHKAGGGAQSIMDESGLRNLQQSRKSRDSMEGLNLGDLGSSRRMASHGANMDSMHERMRYNMKDKENASMTSSGLKHGGRAHKMGGGGLSDYMNAASGNLAGNAQTFGSGLAKNYVNEDAKRNMEKRQAGINLAAKKLAGKDVNVPATRKHGGRAAHPDEAEDKKLIRKEVKASALKHRPHRDLGGKATKKPGTVYPNYESHEHVDPSTYDWASSNPKDEDYGKPNQWLLDRMEYAQELKSDNDPSENRGQGPVAHKHGGRAKKFAGGGMTMAPTNAMGMRGSPNQGNFGTPPGVGPNGQPMPGRSPSPFIGGTLIGGGTPTGTGFENMQPLTGGYGSLPTGGAMNNMPGFNASGVYKDGGRIQRASGGRTKGKGKTNIVINVSPQSSQPPAMPMPPMPPMGGMPPMPPPGAGGPPMPPAGGAGGPPPQLAQALAALQGGPSPMARKSGGRVHQETEFGSGSGLGRLEKPKWYK